MNKKKKNNLSINFGFNYSKGKTKYFDILIYKDHQKHLKATLCKKPCDRKYFVQAKSVYPYSLKNSIADSQVLAIKGVCSSCNE